MEFLKDPENPKTIRFLEKHNRAFAAFQKKLGLSKKLEKEIAKRMGLSKEELAWTDSDGITYQYVFPEHAEYEVLFRNGEKALDMNALAVKGVLNVGLVEPYRNYCTVAVNTTGSPFFELQIYVFESMTWLPNERIDDVADLVWTKDGSAFFYTVVERQRNWTHLVRYHVVGTDPACDVTVYEEKDARFAVLLHGTSSGDYIVFGSELDQMSNEWYVVSSHEPFRQAPLLLEPRAPSLLYAVDHCPDLQAFLLLTNLGALDKRIMKCDVSEARRGKEAWTEWYRHEDARFVLRDVCFVKGFAIIEGSLNAEDVLIVRPFERNESAKEYAVKVADSGVTYPQHLELHDQNVVYNTHFVRFTVSNFVRPTRTFEVNLHTGESRLLHEEPANNHDPSKYHSELVWADARDGKRVPVSLVYRKDSVARERSLVLYGYSAYGLNEYPSFRNSVMALMDRGFCYAICHARGSSTLGRAWYDGGRKETKMNSFFDVIDSAVYLAKHGYCHPNKIVLDGASAGGLLVLASLVLASPLLFAGVIAEVPFCQVIDSMMDKSLPLTMQELDEWGDPAESPEMMEYMRQYSPYDNLMPDQRYPPVYLTGALADSQVRYHEPAMFAAKLEKCHPKNKVLLFTEMDSFGHGGNSQRLSGISEVADAWAFAIWATKRRKSSTVELEAGGGVEEKQALIQDDLAVQKQIRKKKNKKNKEKKKSSKGNNNNNKKKKKK